ncbi:polysaccharide deacetylase family protein [Spirosoma sp. KUDC1026]|uniref:polysaccharide deacetylase family protein n=1 Tax=Spirosoma sp. KUDC1026 TaxID=2745947 RepID=UPI00159B9477|nr:polysaccharide deacetylase family protein [Spirosoma sp. KUDC1026]QKZ11134.1 polysaccharide deacetylase family protein [Spirosoma sp. KUDC1026]
MFLRHTLSFLTVASLTVCLSSGLMSCQSKGSDTTEAPATTAAASTTNNEAAPTESVTATAAPASIPAGKVADAATILARPQVPVLCYHQIRDWRPKDSQSAKDYIIPPAMFREHMQILADSGYHTILPDQLYAYLATGAALPSKPVMITFDDGDLEQYTVAAPELEKHGFKASFFIMTVAIGRRGKQPYMDKAQIKDLSDRGHVIGAHTWDHHNVKKYQGDDWKTQIDEPNAKLESITGKPVKYFAFPFGLWNKEALPELQKRGYLAAFSLATKRDDQMPLYTVRRIIAGGQWKATTMYRNMIQSFD